MILGDKQKKKKKKKRVSKAGAGGANGSDKGSERETEKVKRMSTTGRWSFSQRGKKTPNSGLGPRVGTRVGTDRAHTCMFLLSTVSAKHRRKMIFSLKCNKS